MLTYILIYFGMAFLLFAGMIHAHFFFFFIKKQKNLKWKMKLEIPPPVKHRSVSSVTVIELLLRAHTRRGRWIDLVVETTVPGVYHTPSFIKRILVFKRHRRKRNGNGTESAHFLKSIRFVARPSSEGRVNVLGQLR